MSTTDTLWHTRCPVPTAFSIAVQHGRLDEALRPEGVQVQSIAVSTDPQVRQAHFEQILPGFFRHGFAGPIDWDAFIDDGPLEEARRLLAAGELVGAEA